MRDTSYLAELTKLKKSEYYDLPNRNYAKVPLSDSLMTFARFNICLSLGGWYWWMVKIAKSFDNRIALMILAIMFIVVSIAIFSIAKRDDYNKVSLCVLGFICMGFYWFFHFNF